MNVTMSNATEWPLRRERKADVLPQRWVIDLRLWLPTVAVLLLINIFGAHQVVGTWLASIASVIFVLSMVRTYRALSVVSAIVFITMLYGFAPAYDIFQEWGVSRIDETTYVESFLPILLLYVAGIGTAYGLVVDRRREPSKSHHAAQTGNAEIGSGRHRYLLLLILAIAYFTLSVDQYGLVTGELSRAEIYQGEILGLRIIRAGIIFGAMYGFIGLLSPARIDAKVWRDRLVWLAAIAVYLYVDLMIFGDRRIFLSAALAMLVAANPRPRTMAWLAIVGTPFIVFLWIFSFLRGVPLGGWLQIYDQLDWQRILNLANGEFGGWTRIASDLLSVPFAEVQQNTVVSTPLSLIPASIFPERPAAPSIWYVNTFDPATAVIGGGWGFVLPLEGYLNGWYIGSALFGLMVGAVAGRLAIAGGMARMLAIFVFAFSFRSDLVSLLQQGILTAAFAVAYRPTSVLQLFR